jgi:hypothetical protein
VLTLVAGLVVLLRENRNTWFFGDDWEFIVNRGLHHAGQSIWQPHNEHWSTLPILLYRFLFTVFGLDFTPYILVALFVHLLLAHLIWRTCLREGADAWIATALVALFVVLGSGAENLTWAFQLAWIGSLMFGYLALEVARRSATVVTDVIVALLLLAALMCSTIGDVMVIAVAVFLFLSRHWRAAARPLVLPVFCYALWYGLVGRHAVSNDHVTLSTYLDVPGYIWNGVSSALGSTFDLADAGGALLIGLLVWIVYAFPILRRAHAAVLGLALGTGCFYLLTGIGRQGIGAPATSSRYVYVAMALLIPVLTTLLAITSRPKLDLRLPVITVVLVLIVANLGLLRSFATSRSGLMQSQKQQILTTATLLARGVPSLTLRPIQYGPDLTTTALRNFIRDGQLQPVTVSPAERVVAETAMNVAASSTPLVPGTLAIASTSEVASSVLPSGCSALDPTGPTPQAILTSASRGGSIAVTATPNSGLTGTLSKSNVTATVPALAVGPTGHAVVNVDVPGSTLVLALPPGRTTFCPVQS